MINILIPKIFFLNLLLHKKRFRCLLGIKYCTYLTRFSSIYSYPKYWIVIEINDHQVVLHWNLINSHVHQNLKYLIHFSSQKTFSPFSPSFTGRSLIVLYLNRCRSRSNVLYGRTQNEFFFLSWSQFVFLIIIFILRSRFANVFFFLFFITGVITWSKKKYK